MIDVWSPPTRTYFSSSIRRPEISEDIYCVVMDNQHWMAAWSYGPGFKHDLCNPYVEGAGSKPVCRLG